MTETIRYYKVAKNAVCQKICPIGNQIKVEENWQGDYLNGRLFLVSASRLLVRRVEGTSLGGN
jgi:hypothetical protein